MIGPCMCGDPECSKCFPGSYRRQRAINSPEYARYLDRRYDAISNDPVLLEEAIFEHGPDLDTLQELVCRGFTGNTFSELENAIAKAVEAQATLEADEWLEAMEESG